MATRIDRSTRWTTRVLAALAVVAIATASAACGGGSSAEELCASLCPTYLQCDANVAAAPLFCEDALASACDRACLDAVEGVGDAQLDFIDCARCVLESDADAICTREDAQEAGEDDCPDECTTDGVGEASSDFFDDFDADWSETLYGTELDCDGTGTVSWDGSDPLIQHRTGEADGDRWGCDGASTCAVGHLFFGPYVTLPPGRYVAGFEGLRVEGPAGSSVYVDVYAGAEVAYEYVPVEDASGEVSLSFELEARTSGVEVRLQTDSLVESASARRVFIRRR